MVGTKKLVAARTNKIAANMFGPLPLIAGEDPSQYEERFARVVAAVKPKDFIEEMAVRDIVDLDWEVGRLRGVKAGLFAAGLPASLFAKLIAAPKMTETKARQLAQRFAAGDTSAAKEVDKVLASMGLTMDVVTGHTMMHRMRDFEAIERLIADVESRRYVALRELDRRRSALAAATLREEDVVDADFEDVGPGDDRADDDSTDDLHRHPDGDYADDYGDE